MASLTPQESEKLMRVVVRGQTQLMGFCIDQSRASLPSERQFKQVQMFIKGREQGIRKVIAQALVEAGLIEPIPEYDLAQMK